MFNLVRYISIILLSTIFALYLFEFFLFIKTDTTSKLDFYYNLKKKKNNVVLALTPIFFGGGQILHPPIPSNFINDINFDQKIKNTDDLHYSSVKHTLSGVSNSLTILCNENGYFSTYQSDRYGFNNPNDEWDKKQIDYMLIGDSFTQGACVNRPNDIASVIRKTSNKTVLNLGVSSIGPYEEFAILREYFFVKKPKNIIWIFYEGNDLYDLADKDGYPILRHYQEDEYYSQGLMFDQRQVDKLGAEYIETEIKNQIRNLQSSDKPSKIKTIYQFIKLYKTRVKLFGNKNEYVQKKKNDYIKQKTLISLTNSNLFWMEKFTEILKKTKNFAKKNNSKLYFVYLPEFGRYKPNFENDILQEIKSIITEEVNIPFINIDELVFKKEKNPLIFFPNKNYGHYNTLGYKKIANSIYEYVKNN